MCVTCWKYRGEPKIDTPEIRRVADLIKWVYGEVSPVGGPLHIVIDDWNLDDGCIQWCIDNTIKGENGWAKLYKNIAEDAVDTGQDPAVAVKECKDKLMDLATSMLKMTEEERASALALRDGFWGEESSDG